MTPYTFILPFDFPAKKLGKELPNHYRIKKQIGEAEEAFTAAHGGIQGDLSAPVETGTGQWDVRGKMESRYNVTGGVRNGEKQAKHFCKLGHLG